MNIITEEIPWNIYEGTMWMAIDGDSYDGPESHVGNGSTEKAAINDLVEQVVEKLEVKIHFLRAENKVLLDHAAQETERIVQALNRRVTEQIERKAPETDALQPRGDLQNEKEGQDSGPLPRGHGEAHSDVVTPDAEDLQCRAQGRMDDDFDHGVEQYPALARELLQD